MAAAGLNPHDDDKPFVRVPDERLSAFDRLMEQGGIDAVIKAILSQMIGKQDNVGSPRV